MIKAQLAKAPIRRWLSVEPNDLASLWNCSKLLVAKHRDCGGAIGTALDRKRAFRKTPKRGRIVNYGFCNRVPFLSRRWISDKFYIMVVNVNLSWEKINKSRWGIPI